MAFHTRRKNPAVGGITGGHTKPRVAISFDPEMLEALRRAAVSEAKPFAAKVREVLALGLARAEA